MVYTAMEKSRIVTIRVWHGRQKLNDRQIPNFRGVRVALGTGYNRVEGNRRALRHGRVSPSPTEILTFRFATFASLCASTLVGYTLTAWGQPGGVVPGSPPPPPALPPNPSPPPPSPPLPSPPGSPGLPPAPGCPACANEGQGSREDCECVSVSASFNPWHFKDPVETPH